MGISQSLAATAMQNQYNTQANKLAIGNRNANNAIQATSLNTSLDNTTYINNQRADLAQLNNVVNGVVGVAGNAASGNVGGAVSALGGAVMNGVNTEANRSINQYRRPTFHGELDEYQRGHNKSGQHIRLSDYSAFKPVVPNHGGYERGLCATFRVRRLSKHHCGYQRTGAADATDTPDHIRCHRRRRFYLANGIVGVLVRFKTCAPSALRSVGEYMLRYGYFIQRFITPPQSLECMTKFTYCRCKSVTCEVILPRAVSADH